MVLQTALKKDDNTPAVVASEKVCLNLTIFLPQTGLPVRIRGVQFLVASSEMPETLLGRPLLKAMGFDFNEHLHRVALLIDGKSEKEVQGGNCRLASTAFRGLSYTEGDYDKVKLPECLQAGFGDDKPADIEDAISSAVEEAKKNGISPSGLDGSANYSKKIVSVAAASSELSLLSTYGFSQSNSHQTQHRTENLTADILHRSAYTLATQFNSWRKSAPRTKTRSLGGRAHRWPPRNLERTGCDSQ